MLRRLKLLGCLASIACLPSLRGEVEATINGVDGVAFKKKVEFPVLISLRDNQDRPVKGAIVALEELGLNLSSDEEIVREAKARTDENGMIVVMHPAFAPETTPKSFTIKIHSVVTIVCDGYPTETIKLQDYFKEGLYSHSESTVPHLKLILSPQKAGRLVPAKNAQQGGRGDGDKPPN